MNRDFILDYFSVCHDFIFVYSVGESRADSDLQFSSSCQIPFLLNKCIISTQRKITSNKQTHEPSKSRRPRPQCHRSRLSRRTLLPQIPRRRHHRRRRLLHRQPLRRPQNPRADQHPKGRRPRIPRGEHVPRSGHRRFLSRRGGQYHEGVCVERDQDGGLRYYQGVRHRLHRME